MKIKNKSIIENKCVICDSECNKKTLTILGQTICSKCVDKITILDVDNPDYYKVKDKIKKTLLKYL